MNLYAYCNNDPVNLCDPSGHFAISALLIALGTIVASVVISIAIGNYEYEKYDSQGKIEMKDNGSIEIFDSYKIRNPIARLTFINRLTKSEKYSGALNNRNMLSLLFEWDLHNLATDFLIATQIVTAPFNLLTSNGMFWVIPNEIRKHSDDVYLDNKKKWWDILGWF